MAVLLATGTTAADSADFTVTTASTLFLVSTAQLPSGASIRLDIKGANNVYYPIGRLDGGIPLLVLSGPGIYRVSRSAGPDVGVDRT